MNTYVYLEDIHIYNVCIYIYIYICVWTSLLLSIRHIITCEDREDVICCIHLEFLHSCEHPKDRFW